MYSDLNIVKPNIIPSRKIDAYELPCRNFALANALATLCEMIHGNIKSDSNNMQAAVIPSDVTANVMAWGVFKKQIEFARKHNDGPQSKTDQGFHLFIPTDSEIMLMPNKKFKVINNHYFQIVMVALGTDAAKVGANFDNASFKAINKEIIVCDAAMKQWLGTGVDNDNTGEEIPLFVKSGVIRPDMVNVTQRMEPSADAPLVGMPDAVDVLRGQQN